MKILRRTYMWAVYAFLYIPILVVIAYSVNNAKYTTDWKGFTWKWYQQLFSNQQLMDAAANSLMVATVAATCATVLGTLAALCIHRYRFTGRKVLHGLTYVLTVSPDIVMGISLLIFFIFFHIELGFGTLLAAHITLCLPFVTVTVLGRFSEFDEDVVAAAKDLGASEGQAFRHVILPLIMPAVMAGWLLSFTLSMDDVLISFFVTGPNFDILPLRIYSMVRLGVKPDINALSAVLFCLTIVLVLLAHTLSKARRRP
ncbi:ABC-type transporter, integral membrane subunit [Oleidesulfovibrio alaskensis G20]|jgi:spermidine/putrescine transport system permease protein|uniref:Spermidine/putrescine transport system permease protein PotC n=1 Tax=Oleidesulfovibrio alaskensis (strain ATCC BAA-1058 / DSM 17464 / G20) TaxID=207559 RepID=Q30V31_OLEA2|nr:spermidine/putrescine ABC transporter permease PotC [Oleidesulfovibrio alaskensis]ABB40465.1 ABC-type transporter, integral membrane subunit [Oleidesulfovibrio alaskensis G20]MBG0772719.1 spermidine/putrescine ABC transporter permease PotC [Oleidesulfovibrio alaskensis]MBL3581932.1 spermidine/putrescine ABC transporter permease PotC [Oleidesulfovibrio alaskensis]